MQKINYPKEQMHRIQYTKLTPAQITDKLAPAAIAGPSSASPLSDVLAGSSLKINTDSGAQLNYTFKSKNKLILQEQGHGRTESGYAALTLNGVVLFSHLVPRSQRGYMVVIDQSSNLATVVEFWLSGYQDNREVQRELHYGYVEIAGKEAPKERHALTNRLEGKGYHWRQDTGIRTLEIYPSVLYSTFVELTRLGGELCFCAPSDYVRLDDETYLYSRVEAEFSGTMTVYVLDLNRIKQVGMRLGFDEHDTLHYYLFTGTGESLGQIAHFEPFDDHGEKISLGSRPAPTGAQRRESPEAPGTRLGSTGKGERPVYRPLLTNPAMTKAEVEEAIAKSTAVFAPRNPMAGNSLPLSSYLVGKELTVRYDDGGPTLSYKFETAEKLYWRRQDEARWREETYRAWEPAPDVIFFGHLLGGAPDHDSVAIAIDFENALTTCVHGWIGTKYMANEAARKTWFGVVEMAGLTAPQYRRHQFTDELVGRALTWNYSPGLTSMHVYTTPHSFSWIIFLGGGAGGLEWSGPAQYVKLRDDLYLFNWLEEACNGTLGVLVINMRTLHDCGIGYHCGKQGLSLSGIGAQARHAGCYDIRRFYGPKEA